MSERAHGPLPVTALRIGGTEFGAATAMVDDEALLLARAESDEPPLRVRLSSIATVHPSGDDLELMLADGTGVSLAAPAELRNAILHHCRTLPELTRTLRAFGSSRGRRHGKGRESEATEQRRFFSPLLEARRVAGGAEGADAILAFDVDALTAALTETIHVFASDRHLEAGPARRALEAELVDVSEPLVMALDLLAGAARSASASVENLALWRAWSAQLRATFETADRVWLAIDSVLEAAHRRRPVG